MKKIASVNSETIKIKLSRTRNACRRQRRFDIIFHFNQILVVPSHSLTILLYASTFRRSRNHRRSFSLPDKHAVPHSIFPLGHSHTPPLERQARFCGTVWNCQSKLVWLARKANAGTEEMVGSSGPASRSKTLWSEFSLRRVATTTPAEREFDV